MAFGKQSAKKQKGVRNAYDDCKQTVEEALDKVREFDVNLDENLTDEQFEEVNAQFKADFSKLLEKLFPGAENEAWRKRFIGLLEGHEGCNYISWHPAVAVLQLAVACVKKANKVSLAKDYFDWEALLKKTVAISSTNIDIQRGRTWQGISDREVRNSIICGTYECIKNTAAGSHRCVACRMHKKGPCGHIEDADSKACSEFCRRTLQIIRSNDAYITYDSFAGQTMDPPRSQHAIMKTGTLRMSGSLQDFNRRAAVNLTPDQVDPALDMKRNMLAPISADDKGFAGEASRGFDLFTKHLGMLAKEPKDSAEAAAVPWWKRLALQQLVAEACAKRCYAMELANEQKHLKDWELLGCEGAVNPGARVPWMQNSPRLRAAVADQQMLRYSGGEDVKGKKKELKLWHISFNIIGRTLAQLAASRSSGLLTLDIISAKNLKKLKALLAAQPPAPPAALPAARAPAAQGRTFAAASAAAAARKAAQALPGSLTCAATASSCTHSVAAAPSRKLGFAYAINRSGVKKPTRQAQAPAMQLRAPLQQHGLNCTGSIVVQAERTGTRMGVAPTTSTRLVFGPASTAAVAPSRSGALGLQHATARSSNTKKLVVKLRAPPQQSIPAAVPKPTGKENKPRGFGKRKAIAADPTYEPPNPIRRRTVSVPMPAAWELPTQKAANTGDLGPVPAELQPFCHAPYPPSIVGAAGQLLPFHTVDLEAMTAASQWRRSSDSELPAFAASADCSWAAPAELLASLDPPRHNTLEALPSAAALWAPQHSQPQHLDMLPRAGSGSNGSSSSRISELALQLDLADVDGQEALLTSASADALDFLAERPQPPPQAPMRTAAGLQLGSVDAHCGRNTSFPAPPMQWVPTCDTQLPDSYQNSGASNGLQHSHQPVNLPASVTAPPAVPATVAAPAPALAVSAAAEPVRSINNLSATTRLRPVSSQPSSFPAAALSMQPALDVCPVSPFKIKQPCTHEQQQQWQFAAQPGDDAFWDVLLGS